MVADGSLGTFKGGGVPGPLWLVSCRRIVILGPGTPWAPPVGAGPVLFSEVEFINIVSVTRVSVRRGAVFGSTVEVGQWHEIVLDWSTGATDRTATFRSDIKAPAFDLYNALMTALDRPQVTAADWP
jgi:hypothetical protein